MAPWCLKPRSVTIKQSAKHAVCTMPCREIGGDVPIVVDGDLKCPLPRSVTRLDQESRLGVMTYPT